MTVPVGFGQGSPARYADNFGTLPMGPVLQGGERRIDFSQSPYTVQPSDAVILVDASLGAVTVNLPPAAQKPGRVITIAKVDPSAPAVTIQAAAGDTIEGNATIPLPVPMCGVTLMASTQANLGGWRQFVAVGASVLTMVSGPALVYNNSNTPKLGSTTRPWANFYANSFYGAQREISANDSFQSYDFCVFVNTAGGPVTVTMNSAAGGNPLGQLAVIAKVTADANAVTIAAAGGEVIDGAASVSLAGGARRGRVFVAHATATIEYRTVAQF